MNYINSTPIKIVFGILFISLSAQLTLNVGDIPVTSQTLSILIIALIFSPMETAIAIFSYLILGSMGLPIFADGAAGIEKITGGSGGFLIGFLIAGYSSSLGFKKANNTSFVSILKWTTIGTFIILFFGNLRLVSLYGIENGLNYGFYPFWKGAIIKILIGSGLVYLYYKSAFSASNES